MYFDRPWAKLILPLTKYSLAMIRRVSKSYRIPDALKQPIEDELNILLEAGVLRQFERL
jgi:hypothetical protein